MIIAKFIKVALKTLLISDHWLCTTFRRIVSGFLFRLAAIAKPVNSTTSNFFNIYACVLAFEPNRLVAQINSNDAKLDNHLIVASRAFFEIAFARGELFKIYNFLQNTTTQYPYLFTPWKLLHYCYYFTKSWESLLDINALYENFRRDQLKSTGILNYDVIFGDHVTASIGHSQIFFDFEILRSRSPTSRPKIAVCDSIHDRMSSFYRELLPDMVEGSISVDLSAGQRPDFLNFVQDSFPFLVTKKYFGYQEERGRAKYLASWAATGAKAFKLNATQKIELELFLNSFGIKEHDWYVVMHVREGADNSIRNADIDTYHSAIDAITLNGGWIFRIGDSSMTPLRRKNMQRVVDLPFSNATKPHYIDLYLLATARFVICTASGPSDFPFYFNVPRLVTNWPVMYALFGTSNDICLPVSYYCNSRNAIVPLSEQLNSPVYESNSTLQSLQNIIAIQNSSKQIERGAMEMIELTSQKYSKAHFPKPIPNSLSDKHKDKFWFMGSISKTFLEDNPSYLD
jgi:putative glycosyltransferase (TIGR04372 family)